MTATSNSASKEQGEFSGELRRVNWQPSNFFGRHSIVAFRMTQPQPRRLPVRCAQFLAFGRPLRSAPPRMNTTSTRFDSHRKVCAKIHPSLRLTLIRKNSCNDSGFDPLFNFSSPQIRRLRARQLSPAFRGSDSGSNEPSSRVLAESNPCPTHFPHRPPSIEAGSDHNHDHD